MMIITSLMIRSSGARIGVLPGTSYMHESNPRTNVALKWTSRFLVGVIALFLGFSSLYWMMITAPQAEVDPSAEPARSVITIQASSSDVRRHFTGYGIADAVYHADVPSRVTSTVIEVPDSSRPGSPVVEGQVLAQLDDADFREEEMIAQQGIVDIEAQLASLGVEQEAADQRVLLVEQEVELAAADLERIKELYEREAAHQREVDQLTQQLLTKRTSLVNVRQEADMLKTQRTRLLSTQRSQEANLRLAKQRIQRCRITSPNTGFIETIDVTEGERISAGMRIARVVDPSRIEIPLRLPSSSRSHLSIGDSVELHATGQSSSVWDGRLVRISPEDDPDTRTIAAYIEYEQGGGEAPYLAPGLFVRGEVSGALEQSRWIVPRRAVKNDRLLLVEEGQVVSRPVDVAHFVTGTFDQFGLPDSDWIVLETPLREGESVILNPTRALFEGLPVKEISAADAMAAARRALDDEEQVQ